MNISFISSLKKSLNFDNFLKLKFESLLIEIPYLRIINLKKIYEYLIHIFIPWWRSSCPLQQLQSFFMMIMTQFHLNPFTPDAPQLINLQVRNMRSFLKYNPGIIDLLVRLVELSKVDPKGEELAYGLLGVNSLHRLGVGVDDLPGFPLQQGHTLLPLYHVVRVLAEQDGVQEERSSVHQIFKPNIIRKLINIIITFDIIIMMIIIIKMMIIMIIK